MYVLFLFEHKERCLAIKYNLIGGSFSSWNDICHDFFYNSLMAMGSWAIEVTLVLLEFCNFLIRMQQPSQFLVLCILDNEKQKISHCRNSSKIPHCRNSSKI